MFSLAVLDLPVSLQHGPGVLRGNRGIWKPKEFAALVDLAKAMRGYRGGRWRETAPKSLTRLPSEKYLIILYSIPMRRAGASRYRSAVRQVKGGLLIMFVGFQMSTPLDQVAKTAAA